MHTPDDSVKKQGHMFGVVLNDFRVAIPRLWELTETCGIKSDLRKKHIEVECRHPPVELVFSQKTK